MHQHLAALDWLGLERGDVLAAGLALYSVGPVLGVALGLYRRRWGRGRPGSPRAVDTLRTVTLQEFALASGATGRRIGYDVLEVDRDPGSAMVDQVLWKDGARYLIRSSSAPATRVGLRAVHEAVGAAHHVGAQAVVVVGLSGFSLAARAYAGGKPVHLLDGLALLNLLEPVRPQAQPAPRLLQYGP